jgi:hypothetical protein
MNFKVWVANVVLSWPPAFDDLQPLGFIPVLLTNCLIKPPILDGY